MKDIGWGYNGVETRALPENTLRWGARAILENGYLDILHDRCSVSTQHPKIQKLLKALTGIRPLLNEGVQRLWNSGRLRTDSGEVFVLFEDGLLKVVGSANRSYGYFYVTAWLKPLTGDRCIEELNQRLKATPVSLHGDITDWADALIAATEEV